MSVFLGSKWFHWVDGGEDRGDGGGLGKQVYIEIVVEIFLLWLSS